MASLLLSSGMCNGLVVAIFEAHVESQDEVNGPLSMLMNGELSNQGGQRSQNMAWNLALMIEVGRTDVLHVAIVSVSTTQQKRRRMLGNSPSENCGWIDKTLPTFAGQRLAVASNWVL